MSVDSGLSAEQLYEEANELMLNDEYDLALKVSNYDYTI